MSTSAVLPVRYFTNVRGWILHTLVFGGYVGFFSMLWGPLAAWKVVVGIGLWLLLGVGLAVGDPEPKAIRRPRRRFQPGERAARARARWPAARRYSATLGGILLCAIGIGQAAGIEVEVGNYPLLCGLCIIVSLAVGVPLIAIAGTR